MSKILNVDTLECMALQLLTILSFGTSTFVLLSKASLAMNFSDLGNITSSSSLSEANASEGMTSSPSGSLTFFNDSVKMNEDSGMNLIVSGSHRLSAL